MNPFPGSIDEREREPVLVFHEVLLAAGARLGRCDRLAGQPIGSTLVPVRAVVGTDTTATIAWPHPPQKCSVGSLPNPQCRQGRQRAWPQAAQNCRVARLSV